MEKQAHGRSFESREESTFKKRAISEDPEVPNMMKTKQITIGLNNIEAIDSVDKSSLCRVQKGGNLVEVSPRGK